MVEAKIEFSVYDLVMFLSNNYENLATEAVYNSINNLTKEDVQYLRVAADDELIKKICALRNFPLPEQLPDEEPEIEEDEDFDDEESENIDFFGGLVGVLDAESIINKNRPKKHSGYCDGNCAKCPPHYGYRYERWYYGKGHAYGCEFGGNKGDGSL